MIAVFIAIMYFLMIRPQQKRMREHQEMVGALGPGSRVLMNSGMFGTIVHAGERQFIVELAPGVEVTVLKSHVAKSVASEDEEFEFEGEGGDDVALEGVETDVQPGDATLVPDEEREVRAATDEELEAMFNAPEEEPPAKPEDDEKR